MHDTKTKTHHGDTEKNKRRDAGRVILIIPYEYLECFRNLFFHKFSWAILPSAFLCDLLRTLRWLLVWFFSVFLYVLRG